MKLISFSFLTKIITSLTFKFLAILKPRLVLSFEGNFCFFSPLWAFNVFGKIFVSMFLINCGQNSGKIKSRSLGAFTFLRSLTVY